MKDLVPIVDALLHHAVGTSGQMQLTGKPAGVTGIGQQSTDKLLGGRHGLAILAATRGARITPGQKRGATGGAYRALTIRTGKSGALRDQCVNVRRADVRVAQRGNSIRPLLISADPQDVRRRGHAVG